MKRRLPEEVGCERRKRVWENQMNLRACGLQVPVTGVSYLCPATHAPYQGPHEATVPVRVWPRPQARKEHQTPPLSPGSKCSSLGEWWPESAHCLFLKGKVTGDPKPSPSSPRQPSEWATLRMPSQQCVGVYTGYCSAAGCLVT